MGSLVSITTVNIFYSTLPPLQSASFKVPATSHRPPHSHPSQVSRSRLRCSIDRRENLMPRRRIEFMTVEMQKQTFSDSCLSGVRGACSRRDASTNARAVSRMAQPMNNHAAPHLLHEHGAIAFLNIRWCIGHRRILRFTFARSGLLLTVAATLMLFQQNEASYCR